MKLRPFELVLVVSFAVMAIAALIILRTFSPGAKAPNEEGYVGPVQIWGTLPSAPVNEVLGNIKVANELYEQVTYRSISSESFDQTLIEALADGTGPDLILMSHEGLVEQRRRIQPYSYESWPLRDFQDTYLDGSLIFALSDGIYGTPLLVDPLMMYWNRDILTNAGFLSPPKTWEELVNVQLPALVTRAFDRSILRAVVALGVYSNTENGFGVLSTLLIQSGSDLVTERVSGDRAEYTVSLDNTLDSNYKPYTNSLSFYLRFGQPTNTLYSWNRSFSSDLSEFISEDLVFYFGYASEGKEIEELNPNLNFDIAEMPQGAGADIRRTYGKFYALSPLRSSDNLNGAFTVLGTLSVDSTLFELAQATNMVPAKRGLVELGSNDTYGRVAYRSAPITYGWLSPSKSLVDTIFSDTVNDVNENRSGVSTAAINSQEKIKRLYD